MSPRNPASAHSPGFGPAGHQESPGCDKTDRSSHSGCDSQNATQELPGRFSHKVVYLATLVAGNIPRNLARARRWLHWCYTRYPGIAILAPYLVECELYEDGDPAQREHGLRRMESVARRCDELWLCGGQVTAGMQREANACKGIIRNFTSLGEEPPDV